VELAAKHDVQRAALFPDEWIVYSDCASRTSCTAELRYEGYPVKALAIDHYRVKSGRAVRRGPAHIEVTLATDEVTDCSGRYAGSGDPRVLMECAS
jgi:hypothetical protein